jgi:hypothetical protein
VKEPHAGIARFGRELCENLGKIFRIGYSGCTVNTQAESRPFSSAAGCR